LDREPLDHTTHATPGLLAKTSLFRAGRSRAWRAANLATRTLPSLVVPCVLVAASALVSARAEAQAPPGEVQPVPYTQSQPVPYGTPSEPHPPTEAGPDAAPVESQPQVGGDAVTLREGEVIRGVLVESLPNDHATVQLPNGQLALIPWERIARIDRAPVRGASAPGVAPEDAETAWVHLTSDRPVTLERRSEDPGYWSPVCSLPCDTNVPLRAVYRITGRGTRASAPFQLEARPGERIVIDVKRAAVAGLAGGIVLVSTGPLVGLLGVALLAVTSSAQTSGALSATNSQNQGGVVGLGVVLSVGGLAMTVGGILMIANNAHTHVSQEPTPQAAPPPNDAWLRTPSWREDRTVGALPRATEVPLFHTTF
jgi:hypothetical protein